MRGVGSQSASIFILGSGPASPSALAEGRPFGGYDWHLLKESLLKCGVHPDDCYFHVMNNNHEECLRLINTVKPKTILSLGERALLFLTGKRNIDKWHLSPLDTLEQFTCRKVIPTFNFKRLNAQYDHRFYFYKAVERACANIYPGPWKRKRQNFHHPTMGTFTHEWMLGSPILAIDIETSHGIINTLGIAWSPNDAVAIKCRPEDASSPEEFYHFWQAISTMLSNPDVKKIYQNNIFEAAYFNMYGIQVRGTYHDTMFANKVLYPEFKSGLGNVGRIHTMEPYWKDDGTKDSEGGKRDWNKIEDWNAHLLYNCKDTTGTFEAHLSQRRELEERGLLHFFDSYIMKLAEPVQEMCRLGLPVNEGKIEEARLRLHKEIEQLRGQLSKPFNPRSTKQKMEHFRAKGYKIPKKRVKEGNEYVYKDSLDELAIKKLRLKYPDDQDLSLLLDISKKEKFLSSYIDFSHTRGTANYSIKVTGTETLRMSSGLDPWNRGFNAQTIPKKAKGFFPPPEGHLWLNVDLEKAESFFVAYRSADPTLMRMLNQGDDIHSYVAASIYGVPVEDILEEKRNGNESRRQLGKKSGHGANYSMAATTFQESCLKELNHVITKDEAAHILETYHTLFPNIRKWHAWVRNEIYERSRLDNPLGYHRYFYGRKDDNTFREAYAWEPQSAIPMVTNHMLLGALRQRDKGVVDFNIHLQCHDSLLFSVRPRYLETLITYCKDVQQWHPPLDLPGGRLWIPTSCEYGTSLDTLEKYNGQKLP